MLAMLFAVLLGRVVYRARLIHPLFIKCLSKPGKCGYVYVCWGYRFSLFVRYFYWILELLMIFDYRKRMKCVVY